MFGLGPTELIIILLVIVVFFGASRVPDLGKGLGSGIRNFRDAIRGGAPDGEDVTDLKSPE